MNKMGSYNLKFIFENGCASFIQFIALASMMYVTRSNCYESHRLRMMVNEKIVAYKKIW